MLFVFSGDPSFFERRFILKGKLADTYTVKREVAVTLRIFESAGRVSHLPD